MKAIVVKEGNRNIINEAFRVLRSNIDFMAGKYGNALVLVAVVAIAVNTVIIKPSLERLGTLVVMGWYYIIGLSLIVIFFLLSALFLSLF